MEIECQASLILFSIQRQLFLFFTDSREEEEEATILRLKHLTSQYKVEKEAREELEEEVAKMRRKMEAVDSLENLQMQNEALRRDLEEIMFR